MVYQPTDRERQRYIRYTGTNPLPTFERMFGAVGLAAAGIQQVSGNVIRTNAQSVDKVKAAICLTPSCASSKVTSSISIARA